MDPIQLRLEAIRDEFRRGLVAKRTGVDLHLDHHACERAGLDGDEMAPVGVDGPPAAVEFVGVGVAELGFVDGQVEAIECAFDGLVHLRSRALVDIGEQTGSPEAVARLAGGGTGGDEGDGGRAAGEDEGDGEEGESEGTMVRVR